MGSRHTVPVLFSTFSRERGWSAAFKDRCGSLMVEDSAPKISRRRKALGVFHVEHLLSFQKEGVSTKAGERKRTIIIISPHDPQLREPHSVHFADSRNGYEQPRHSADSKSVAPLFRFGSFSPNVELVGPPANPF